jgi:enolase-phosphatase E1
VSPAPPGVRVVLLDIEGTTTPIAFVHQQLFPFARARLERYLSEHWTAPVVRDVVRRLAGERAADGGAADLAPWRDDTSGALRESATGYALWLMDRDRKSPGLKLLQGVIWDEGYRAGELHGEVFDDVPRALERWRREGLDAAIYSSGSELAQRLLFSSTRHGDLTPFIAGFFDTGVGPKTEAASYRRIAEILRRPAAGILFVSDVAAELAAARDAGYDTKLCLRPGNPAQPDPDRFAKIQSLDEIWRTTPTG